MAICGHNGDNESFIGYSSSIELSFYDENLNEIEIIDITKPIDIIISRDPSVSKYPYQYVNVSQIQFSSDSFILQNSFNLISTNASIHIELKPLNQSFGYLFVFKLGFSPIVNSVLADYDSFKIFCPSKIITLFIYIFTLILLKIHNILK
jgi:hypothetical protein